MHIDHLLFCAQAASCSHHTTIQLMHMGHQTIPGDLERFDDVLFDMDDTSSDDSNIDDISEDEFESLLDELHGAGKGPVSEESKAEPEIVDDTSDGDITDDQFENFLDELHGVGSFGETQSAAPDRLPHPIRRACHMPVQFDLYRELP